MNRVLVIVFLLVSYSVVAQHQYKVDFIHAQAILQPVPLEKKIIGSVVYDFEVLQHVDSVFFDAKNMEFSAITLNGKSVKANNTGKTVVIKFKFKKGQAHQISLNYQCKPKQSVYFLGWEDGVTGNEQIWTQGQGKYTSHWLPSFDDMEEKVEFDLGFRLGQTPGQVISNGVVQTVKSDQNGDSLVLYDMHKPMSSYLLAFAIGNYAKQTLKSKSGITIENYYYPQDSLRVEPTYRHTQAIFDYLEAEIGVAYPWQNYQQVPVRDFLYAGMENTGCTIFSDGYIIDSTAFVDKNYVNVNAHELAHQWFGNLVTEKNGEHHWLHEGFATFYAQLAEKRLFGDDHYYWLLYRSLQQLKEQADQGLGQSLLDPKASSLTFYEKGAWALFALQNEVGHSFFKSGIVAFLNKYQFKNATVDDFMNEMEIASSKPLARFRDQWLADTLLPYEEAMRLLTDVSTSIRAYGALLENFEKAADSLNGIDFYWDSFNSIHIKKQIISQYHNVLPESVLKKAFASDTVPVRQELAIRLDTVVPALKTDFESLLGDKSYVTIENALLKLWMAYPSERAKFLEKTKHTAGLPNKNVRLLWLVLAIMTNEYEPKNTQLNFQELIGYTSAGHGWEVRMGAFQYLEQLGLTDTALKNLIQACTHHSWQFNKYARNLVDGLLMDADYKLRIEQLAPGLNDTEKQFIKTKL